MNNRRTEQFYNKKYIESKTNKTKTLDKNRKLTDKYNLKIKLVSTLIKSKNAFGLVLVGLNANINKKQEVKMENKEVKRKIKKKKFKLTKLGKQVAAGIVAATLLIGTTTVIASTLENSKEEPIETTTMVEELDDIFSNQENLAPIINETTPTITEPVVTETEPTEEVEIIEEIPEETVVVATPTPAIEETTPIMEETMPTQETVNYSPFEIPDSNINLEIGPSSTRNTSDDLLKYNTVRENYGDIIDQIAMETRWDPRLLSAMIAQENPFDEDQTYRGIYGITSIDGIHNGHTYSIGIFDENGNHSVRNITIDVNEINSNPRSAIYAQIAILEEYLRNYDISITGLEVFGSYNGGPATMYGSTLEESFNNFRLSYQYPHDHEYYSNIFYKLNALSFEGINDLYYTNLDGETASFNISFTDEQGALNANYISNTNANTL